MIKGMDFSALEETESFGGRFFCDGAAVDPVECMAANGVNYARLRLWVDPHGEIGEPYMGGTCDIGVISRLARRAKNAGMEVLLDLHYSDFWCDPARQVIPKSWQGLDVPGLCDAIYDFTARTLEHLKGLGLEPAAVQVGNEITNGMLWPIGKLTAGSPREGYDTLAAFLRAGCRAVREHSSAKIVLHLENSGNQALWQEWFDAITERAVDFDIIGASYYPYWHGSIEAMCENMARCIRRYGKDVWIVETAYAFTTEHFDPADTAAKLCITDPEKRADGSAVSHPLTREGQAAFIRDLLAAVSRLPEGRGKGVFWWEPSWLPMKGTSWASAASLRYCGEEGKKLGNEWANQCLFDYAGNALPALKVFSEF